MEEKIKELLLDLRPLLNQDGGDIEFIKYEDGYLYIKLTGACEHCMYQDETISFGLENYIREQVPDLKGIINVSL